MITPAPKNTRSAFTLTEMLVVVAIIVVLAGVAVPITLNVLSDAKVKSAEAQIKGSIAPAIRTFYLNNGVAPTNVQQLLPPPQGNGNLSPDAQFDPWQRPYQFEAQELETGGIYMKIWSDGPNPGNANSMIVYETQG